MTDTRVTRPGDGGEQPRTPKHARRPESEFPWPGAAVAPETPPRLTPPPPGGRGMAPPATPHLGNDYRLRGLTVGSTPPAPAPSTRPAAPRRRARVRQRRRRWLLMVAAVIAAVVLIALLLRLTLIAPFTVPSSAMAPTLQTGDRILVLRSSVLTGSIGRGDIIVFRRPAHFPCRASGSGQYLVQRVIALPGETIWSDHQTIYVDGKRIDERGWYDPDHGAVSSVQISRTTIPTGDYFVLDDNRSNSCDSRSFGAIPGSSALGKVIAVIGRHGNPYLHFF